MKTQDGKEKQMKTSFKKGQKVNWVIYVFGKRADAAIRVIESIGNDGITLKGNASLRFDTESGAEINPASPVAYSKITPIKNKGVK
jgi:hypothetical protein